jgi:hypothetical protein
VSQATESLFAENHEHFFNSIGQTEKYSSRAKVVRVAPESRHLSAALPSLSTLDAIRKDARHMADRLERDATRRFPSSAYRLTSSCN